MAPSLIRQLAILAANAGEVAEALRAAQGTAPRTDREHLLSAGEWLLRAQSVHSDGGYAHSYALARGWERPYPETTGYIIPTLLDLGTHLSDRRFTDSEIG